MHLFLYSVSELYSSSKLNLNWVQSQFRESGVPPCRKEEELGFFPCYDTQNSVVPSLFKVGGTLLSLNWLWTQFKKVQWWVEQQFKFSFCPMNWKWIDLWVQCLAMNLNWTFWTLYSSVQCFLYEHFCFLLQELQIMTDN